MRSGWLRSAALGAAVAGGAAPAAAAGFEGPWSVQVVAGPGPCRGVYSFPVAVNGGRIVYQGNTSMQASGGVDRRGRVRATLNNGRDALSATGSLSGDYGRGTWDAPTRGCSGIWEARRR